MNNCESKEIIKMMDICKTYDGKINVLDKLNLTVCKGEYIVIKGKSGAGKSTLLNILGLLDRHTSGKYLFNNEEIKLKTTEKYDVIRGKNIGFIFQTYNLIEYYSVKDNILMPYMYSERKITGELLNEAEQLLEELELKAFINKPVKLLSGGQKQRCAIARAIIAKTPLIIADEPTGNLDYENAKTISKQFRKMADNNTTVVVVTHNDLLFDNADSFYELKEGKVYKNNAM